MGNGLSCLSLPTSAKQDRFPSSSIGFKGSAIKSPSYHRREPLPYSKSRPHYGIRAEERPRNRSSFISQIVAARQRRSTGLFRLTLQTAQVMDQGLDGVDFGCNTLATWSINRRKS